VKILGRKYPLGSFLPIICQFLPNNVLLAVWQIKVVPSKSKNKRGEVYSEFVTSQLLNLTNYSFLVLETSNCYTGCLSFLSQK
jgi:hypothetical protein